jgi:hypothetical protein
MAANTLPMSPEPSQQDHNDETDSELIPSLKIPRGYKLDKQGKKVVRKGSVLKPLLLLTGCVGIIVMAAFFFSHMKSSVNGAAVVAFNSTRDYAQTPFDVLDAQQICQFQTQEVHGNRLIMSYLDTHSSRFESSLGIYKIFLVAHVGTRSDYEEANIHCYIDPNQHLISHYKTIYPEKSSIMSRALKFFTG